MHAEITEATLRALPALLNPGQDGYDDTSEHTPDRPEAMEDLFEEPIATKMLHISYILRINFQCFEYASELRDG